MKTTRVKTFVVYFLQISFINSIEVLNSFLSYYIKYLILQYKLILKQLRLSKFPFPVIASKPLWFLKFVFFGRFLELMLPNFEFVTQGGFPITKIFFEANCIFKYIFLFVNFFIILRSIFIFWKKIPFSGKNLTLENIYCLIIKGLCFWLDFS